MTAAAISVVTGAVLVIAGPAAAADTGPSPSSVISWASGGENQVRGQAVASDGTIWVTQHTLDESTGSVLGFAADTSGIVTPKYDITGNFTELQDPVSVALDSSNNIWVADHQAAAVYEFPENSNGNVPPTDIIDIPNDQASGVAIGADGSIYVADGDQALVFDSGATGAAIPAREITGLDGAYALGLQADGTTVVAQENNTILTFAADATGAATPLHRISGYLTQLDASDEVLVSIAVDPWGEIYSANHGNNSVTEYAQDANGNVRPAARLIGGSAGLSGVTSVTVDASGSLYIGGSDGTTNSIRIFNPLFTVSGVTSPSGPLAGGQTVTIHGSTFMAPILGVTFDGVPATDVQLVSPTAITAVVPAHSAGEVDVAVSQANSDQTGVVTATLTNGYRYGTALALTGVDPLPGIGVGIAFLALGAALLVARRRRKTSPAR